MIGKRITDEQKRELFSLRKQGLTYKKIAEKTGIPHGTINGIFHRANTNGGDTKVIVHELPKKKYKAKAAAQPTTTGKCVVIVASVSELRAILGGVM